VLRRTTAGQPLGGCRVFDAAIGAPSSRWLAAPGTPACLEQTKAANSAVWRATMLGTTDPRVDAYIAGPPEWQQAICREVRAPP
jgi:hypothetical protein